MITEDFGRETNSETIGEFFERINSMVRIFSYVYFIRTLKTKGKLRETGIEEKVESFDAESHNSSVHLVKKEKKIKKIKNQKNPKSETSTIRVIFSEAKRNI